MARILQKQKSAIIDFMGDNYDVLFGKHQSIRGPDLRRRKWQELSEIANQLGPPHRDIKGWQRTWTDMKSATKKKLAAVRKIQHATGGGPQTLYLSQDDLLIVNIVKLENMSGLPSINESAVGSLIDENITQRDVDNRLASITRPPARPPARPTATIVQSIETVMNMYTPPQSVSPTHSSSSTQDPQMSDSATQQSIDMNMYTQPSPSSSARPSSQTLQMYDSATRPPARLQSIDIKTAIPSNNMYTPPSSAPTHSNVSIASPSETPTRAYAIPTRGRSTRGRGTRTRNQPTYSAIRGNTESPQRQMLNPIAPAYLSRHYDNAVRIQDTANSHLLTLVQQNRTIIDLLLEQAQNRNRENH